MGKSSHCIADTGAGRCDSCHRTADVIAGLPTLVTVAAVCVLEYEERAWGDRAVARGRIRALPPIRCYTASLRLVKLKSRTLSGGMMIAAPGLLSSLALTRTGAPNASTLLSMKIGDSLYLKFLIACVTLPFSIRNVPSRVRPVNRMVR